MGNVSQLRDKALKIMINLSIIRLICIVSLLVATKVGAGNINTNILFRLNPVGTFIGQADLCLRYPVYSDNELEVQVLLFVGDVVGSRSLPDKLKGIQSDAVSVWVLTDSGQTLHLHRKLPSPGHRPFGVGNGVSGYGYVTFDFDHNNTNQLSAVVVKFNDQFRVLSISGN